MQSARSDRFALAPSVRYLFIAFVVLLFFGSGLLWMPNIVRPHWPWPITPFNGAFLGGVYLTELVAGLMVIATNHRAPSRVTLPMSLAFTGVVALVTLRYLDRFDYAKVATYAWFVAYAGSVSAIARFRWRYRYLPPADPTRVPLAWRILLYAQTA